MRCLLHVRYRKAGVLHPAAETIEAEAEDLAILGPLAEVLGKPAPGPDQPQSGAGVPLRDVLAAMDAADPERKNKAWWTRMGKPEVAELRRRGHILTAAERDSAWEKYLSNRAT